MLTYVSLKDIEPYDIPGVRRLAQMCGIALSREASYGEVQERLFPIWGTERAFVENAPMVARALRLDGHTVPSREVLHALQETGTLDRIPLRNYRGKQGPTGSVAVIHRGAVANWMERSVREGKSVIELHGLQVATTRLVASERLCDTGSEVDNFFVKLFHDGHNRYPTEDELLPQIVFHVTGLDSLKVVAPSQTEQVQSLIALSPALAHGGIYVPTNANATYVPLQIRRVIREQFGGFDEYGDQFWFSQDSLPLATTPEEAANPATYQRPLTVFSGLVRLINELCLLQGR